MGAIKDLFSKIKKLGAKKLILIGVVLVVLVIAAFFALNRKETKNQATNTNPLIESYRSKLPELEKAAETKKDNPSAHREYAVALYATGDLQKAKEQYEIEEKLNDNDATLYNNLGNVYRDLGKYQEAVNVYQKSIDLNPKQTNPYTNLANLYMYTLAKQDLGIGVYQKGIQNNPDNQDLHVLLATAYESQSNFLKAKETFNEVLKLNKDNIAAKAGLERIKDKI